MHFQKKLYFCNPILIKTTGIMARVCELTGKKAMVGNNVSHAMNRTKRKFKVNLVKKRFYLPEEDRWITMKVSTKALKIINKRGITAVVKEARKKGYLKK